MIYLGDCFDVIPTLPDDHYRLILTSPPYASRRKEFYPTVSEEEYPEWFCQFMELAKPKLRQDGSVLCIIRTNLKNGCISDYVLRTRLAVRDAGWNECEELIWLKTDGYPFGSQYRPMRSYENILWFSKHKNPHIDLYASGPIRTPKNCRGYGSPSSKVFGWYDKERIQGGNSKVRDVFFSARSYKKNHPAAFPDKIAKLLIETFSEEGDYVLDPFCGTGTTVKVAERLGRRADGIEIVEGYIKPHFDAYSITSSVKSD